MVWNIVGTRRQDMGSFPTVLAFSAMVSESQALIILY